MSDDGSMAAFLAARLDEDERLAQQALSEAPPENRETRYPYPERVATCMHDARHRPARVLREVAAKRAILDRWVKSREDPRDIRLVAHAELEGNLALLWAVRHLAAVYSDHPDYRPEWKP